MCGSGLTSCPNPGNGSFIRTFSVGVGEPDRKNATGNRKKSPKPYRKKAPSQRMACAAQAGPPEFALEDYVD